MTWVIIASQFGQTESAFEVSGENLAEALQNYSDETALGEMDEISNYTLIISGEGDLTDARRARPRGERKKKKS